MANNKAELVFPSQPARTERSWMGQLSSAVRRKLDATRQATLEKDTTTYVNFLTNKVPGLQGIPPETIEYLARSWATYVANTFEEGMQAGIENEREFTSSRYDYGSAHPSAMATSAGTAGLG